MCGTPAVSGWLNNTQRSGWNEVITELSRGNNMFFPGFSNRSLWGRPEAAAVRLPAVLNSLKDFG